MRRETTSCTALRHRIRMSGSYDLLLSPEEKRDLDAHPDAVDEVFHRAVRDSIERWIALAEERLEAAGVPGFVILGNDDFPEVADALRNGTRLRYAEDEVCELPGGLEMISFGFSTPTPWNTPRELPEDEIERRLEALASRLQEPEHAVFNIHCPPQGTHLDQAPRLDSELRMVASAGGVEMVSVGSTAVRSVIERYGPMLGLHGHVHDSPGVQEVGRSLCINPGSAYNEGVVRGRSSRSRRSTASSAGRWSRREEEGKEIETDTVGLKKRVFVPAREGRGVGLRAGERFRVVDLEGMQAGDLFAFNANDSSEYASAEHTRVYAKTPEEARNCRLFPRVGGYFVTNRREPILYFEEDHSPGQHDMLVAACDAKRYELLGYPGHDSCVENLKRVMAEFGYEDVEIPRPINFFANSPFTGTAHSPRSFFRPNRVTT